MNQLKAIIFDFDGTMLDTEGIDYEVWQEIYTSHGQELPFAEWMAAIGSHHLFDIYGYLESKLSYSIDRTALSVLHHERCSARENSLTLMPGVLDAIHFARSSNIKIGLATSSGCQRIQHHLERLGITALFDSVKCRDHVALTKPDPALYLAVLEDLQVTAAEALAFEDTPNGIQAAKQAGIFCIAVPCQMTRDLNFDHADVLADCIHPDVIQRYFAV